MPCSTATSAAASSGSARTRRCPSSTRARSARGRAVTLVTALSADDAGDELRAMLAERGIEVADVGLDGPTPEKVRITTGGRPLLRLDRGGTGAAVGEPGAAVRAAIGWGAAVLV